MRKKWGTATYKSNKIRIIYNYPKKRINDYCCSFGIHYTEKVVSGEGLQEIIDDMN